MNEHPNAAIIRSGYEAMEKGDMRRPGTEPKVP